MDLANQRRQFIARVCECLCVCEWERETDLSTDSFRNLFSDSFLVRANNFIWLCNGEWLAERRFNENRSLVKSEYKCVLPLKKSSRLNDSLSLSLPPYFWNGPFSVEFIRNAGGEEWENDKEGEGDIETEREWVCVRERKRCRERERERDVERERRELNEVWSLLFEFSWISCAVGVA